MEIVKAFNSNNLHTEIVIKGTYEKPLFRANDIATVLEISNIRTSINDFNESEKVVHSMDTLGRQQSLTFFNRKMIIKNIILEKHIDNAKNKIIQIKKQSLFNRRLYFQ